MSYNKLEEFIKICKGYKIALTYLFGSQKDNAFKLLNNKNERLLLINSFLNELYKLGSLNESSFISE